MEMRSSTHRRSKTKRRLALVTAAATAAAGLAIGMVTIGSASPSNGPSVGGRTAEANSPDETHPQPLSGVPESNEGRGMVYQGLKPAPEGDPCVGVYVVSKTELCTHGPDAPPRGVDITKGVPPTVRLTAPAPALKDGASSAPPASDVMPGGMTALDARTGEVQRPVAFGSATNTAANAGSKVACSGDGSSGNRVQVLYVHAPGKDRYAKYVASFKKWAAEADTIYNESAKETGGSRRIRFVTDADCTANVLNVEVRAGSMYEFGATNKALAAKGFNRRDRKYMMFVDAKIYCGIGSFSGDERPGRNNRSNFGPSYGRTDAGCWNGSTPAHELGHNLGAVNNSAPHASGSAHCVDEWDIMCYSDSPKYPKMRTLCPERASDKRLDCHHDDYYNTAPKPGSYLDTHWNVANNRFLISGGGDTKPDPNPTPGKGPAAKITQITANSAVVSWTKVPSARGYDIFLNGRKLSAVNKTATRVVRLAPDTSYRIAVAARYAGGKVSRTGPVSTFRTLTAPDGNKPPRPETKYMLVNALTGQAADLWAGSRNNGTVAIAHQRTGYANQRWTFKEAGGDAVTITSAISGKCLQFNTAVAGQYLAQQPCSDVASQKWRLRNAGNGGYQLQPQGSSLVLGVSKRWYYGGWLLELQRKNNQGYQKWTLQHAS